MVKIRFNLGAGPYYKKWKVEFESGMAEYFEPSRVSLVMKNCRLKNRPGSAQKIFDGHQKFVCAWIECDSFELREPLSLTCEEVKYNPRVQPHWTLNEINVDDARFEELTTSGRTVFIT
jgi:hypothetical protein